MTDTVAPAPGTHPSAPSRLFGILTSPRATYAVVAAKPRWLGAFFCIYLVTAVAGTAFMLTEVGRNAIVDQQIAQSEAFGRQVTAQQVERLETMSKYFAYFAPVIQLVSLSLISVVIAGIAFAIFNALMGGDASFKQAFAIVVHSGAVMIVQALFVMPLNYVRETMSSPANLGVFVPFLDEKSFLAMMLGAIDLFLVWWIIILSIGLGVLYRKRTGPIAVTILLIYVAIGAIIAAVKAASGA